jgi:hypothetical protein
MPPGKDLIVLKIPALCIGGSGVGSNAQHGYVVFVRRGGGVDKMRFQFYQKHVLIPYINWLRKEYAGFDISVGSNIPDELTAVSWCDGDLSQLYSVTNEHSMLNDQKVIAKKQNTARTAVEQAADLAKVFKVVNQEARRQTITDIDPSWHPMKMKVTIAFQSDEMKCLNLGSKKTGSLVDFFSVLPAIATKAGTRENILFGMHENGMLDKEKARYPVLFKILGTCRSSIPQELYKKVIDNFTYLDNVVMEQGCIPEKVFDELSFPMDVDVNGKDVFQKTGISQESYQRAKCLTHSTQVGLRKKRVEEIQAKQCQQEEFRQSKNI